MGPSGSGKTTLLNALATRPTGAASTSGTTLLNGSPAPQTTLRALSRFVEQDDALTGALTVRETMDFASRLSPSRTYHSGRGERIEELIEAFGLREQADALVGTPLRKGISGGQKRRLGVASQLVTGPRVLFLDEPTSGLDSVAGWEVVRFLRGVAKREGVSCFFFVACCRRGWADEPGGQLIVVLSIHQPSTATFNLFDKLLLMSQGKTHYFGGVEGVAAHYEALGYQMPVHVNPAEFVLEMVNTDFAVDRESALRRLGDMQLAWTASGRAGELDAAVAAVEEKAAGAVELETTDRKRSLPSLVLTLLHRSFVKSYRDVVVYGIRLAMYLGEHCPCTSRGEGVDLLTWDNRAGCHDGHRLAEAGRLAGVHHPVHQRHLLVCRPLPPCCWVIC